MSNTRKISLKSLPRPEVFPHDVHLSGREDALARTVAGSEEFFAEVEVGGYPAAQTHDRGARRGSREIMRRDEAAKAGKGHVVGTHSDNKFIGETGGGRRQ